MRFLPAFTCLLLCAARAAFAQGESPLEIGLPGDTVFANPSAFVGVETFGDVLLLRAHPGFVPVVAEYTANAPAQAISVSICGVAFPPFSPIAPSPGGLLEIPLGSAEIASAAASVMRGETSCDAADLTGATPDTAPASALAFVSPTDRYDVPAADIAGSALTPDRVTGRYVLSLQFGPATTHWLETATSSHVGEAIEIVVCGDVVMAPVVLEPITGGQVTITGAVEKDQAEIEMARITGRLDCP